jgi:hypothetical protein
MLEADKTYKKYDDQQRLVQEGAQESWDLSYLPALSRIFSMLVKLSIRYLAYISGTSLLDLWIILPI